MVKKKKVVKKRAPRLRPKRTKKVVNKGYTEEIKKKVAQIEKLTKSKIVFQEKYEKARKKLVQDLTKLKNKRNAEKQNLTKLINYMGRK